MVREPAPVPSLRDPAPADQQKTCCLFSNIPPFPFRERPAACSLYRLIWGGLSSDAVHGEQSFLDSCRSHGAFCLLATQSLAALEHALSLQGGARATHEAALSVIWNNCASKLVFRTTDSDVNDRIAALCPEHPHLLPVTRVRPPATLAPGECYALLADGRIERRHLDPWLAPPARRPRRARSRTEPREITR